MGSYMNFKNFGDTAQTKGETAGNFPLAQQSSIYSLTFDEFQNTSGGPGKDFGSMNMEDLLKSIWTAEESQALQSSIGEGNGSVPSGNLQRQGSLTLPRTLSQKTVDEVWRDVLKETIGVNSGVSSLGQREPTLGEMTLEDFLSKAGVVREDVQPSGRPSGSYYRPGLTIGSQQPSQNHCVLANQQPEKNNNIVLNSPNVGINMSGVTSSQPQLHPLFLKQATVTFSSPTPIGNNAQLSSPGTKVRPIVAMTDALNGTIVECGPIVRSGLNNGAVVKGSSPGNNLYPDPIIKISTDTPSVLPSPYNFSEGGRGRRSNSSLEKVVERRRRRMIKNRESAARSRARKQAYTLELEAEVVTLKELNEELRKKQEEYMEMQKNQPWGEKKRCLRRTRTSPW